MSKKTPKEKIVVKTADGKLAEYTPEKFNPDDFSVQSYLYDTNQILTEINSNLRYLIQIIVSANEEKDTRTEKERIVRTIGSGNNR